VLAWIFLTQAMGDGMIITTRIETHTTSNLDYSFKLLITMSCQSMCCIVLSHIKIVRTIALFTVCSQQLERVDRLIVHLFALTADVQLVFVVDTRGCVNRCVQL